MSKKRFLIYGGATVILLCVVIVLIVNGVNKKREQSENEETANVAEEMFETYEEYKETEVYVEPTYYWSDEDDWCHLYSDCKLLRDASTLYEGVYDEAAAAGKEEGCVLCEPYIWWDYDDIEDYVDLSDYRYQIEEEIRDEIYGEMEDDYDDRDDDDIWGGMYDDIW